MAPSPMTEIILFVLPSKSLATDIPSPADIEVELCAVPKGSYSLSDLLVNPDSPPPCRKVRIRSRLPVMILWG